MNEELLVRLFSLASQLNALSQSENCSLVFPLNADGKGQFVDSLKTESEKIILKWETLEEGIERLRGGLDAAKYHIENEKYKALEKLHKDGGSIVSSSQCSDVEIDDAKSSHRFFVDENGLGYVWRTQDYLDSRERAFTYWAKNSVKDETDGDVVYRL